jgi:spore coat protein U-like protein
LYHNNNNPLYEEYMKNLKVLASAVAMMAGLLSTGAYAGTVSAGMSTQATLGSTCVVSASNVSFGAINPAQTGNATANGTITATCTKGSAYTLTVNTGNSGVYTSRSMTGAATGNTDVLAYNLYIDSAHANIFGNPSASSSTSQYSSSGTGGTQTFTMYGQLSLNQYVTPDNYSDNLTVTLNY